MHAQWILLTRDSQQFKASQLLRLAENNGSKTIGNSWYVITFLLLVVHSDNHTAFLMFRDLWAGFEVIGSQELCLGSRNAAAAMRPAGDRVCDFGDLVKAGP